MYQSHSMPSIHDVSTVCAPTMRKFQYRLDGHFPDALIAAEWLLVLAVLHCNLNSNLAGFHAWKSE